MPIQNFFITQTERDTLDALLGEAQGRREVDAQGNPISPPGTHEELYRFLINLTAPSAVRPESESEAGKLTNRFLHGARQVNSDIGFFSIWIRGYTQRQIELRTSDQELSGWLQFASNLIVEQIAQQILDNFEEPEVIGHIPTTSEIAEADASAAVVEVFPQLPKKFRPGDTRRRVPLSANRRPWEPFGRSRVFPHPSFGHASTAPFGGPT